MTQNFRQTKIPGKENPMNQKKKTLPPGTMEQIKRIWDAPKTPWTFSERLMCAQFTSSAQWAIFNITFSLISNMVSSHFWPLLHLGFIHHLDYPLLNCHSIPPARDAVHDLWKCQICQVADKCIDTTFTINIL